MVPYFPVFIDLCGEVENLIFFGNFNLLKYIKASLESMLLKYQGALPKMTIFEYI